MLFLIQVFLKVIYGYCFQLYCFDANIILKKMDNLMLYQLEKDLQIDLKDNIVFQENKNINTVFIRRELQIGTNIPDIVTVKYNSLPKIQTWPNEWTSKYAYYLWLMRKHGAVSIDGFSFFTFEDSKNIIPILRRLLEYEIIIDDDGLYKLSLDYVSMDVEVVSYEAKLFKWKDALNQAIQYKEFSDYAIVAMDPEGIPQKDADLQMFIESGVGLVSMYKNNYEILINAIKNENINSFYYEDIITSTLVPKRQIFWSLLNE